DEPCPPQRAGGVREARRGALPNLLLREPITGLRRGDRGRLSQAQSRVEVLRVPAAVLSQDSGVLGHEREARGDAAAEARFVDRALDEGRSAAAVREPFASRSFTRALTSDLILAIGSGSSRGKRRVDAPYRYFSSPLASPAG